MAEKLINLHRRGVRGKVPPWPGVVRTRLHWAPVGRTRRTSGRHELHGRGRTAELLDGGGRGRPRGSLRTCPGRLSRGAGLRTSGVTITALVWDSLTGRPTRSGRKI